jgi:hypothetical protein
MCDSYQSGGHELCNQEQYTSDKTSLGWYFSHKLRIQIITQYFSCLKKNYTTFKYYFIIIRYIIVIFHVREQVHIIFPHERQKKIIRFIVAKKRVKQFVFSQESNNLYSLES